MSENTLKYLHRAICGFRPLMVLLAVLFTCLIINSTAFAQKPAGGEGKPDTSPHKSEFVNTNGIKINYLDWGGTGDVLLLLTGFGNDAHIFDEFAPKFTDHFHVIGMTRRGWGESEKPKTGYDIETRVEDIRGLLDALKIKKANIVGHSMAGDEMTRFATVYPDRVMKLVYLDAAYDRRHADVVTLADPTVTPFWKRMMLEEQKSPEAAKVVVSNMPPREMWDRFRAMIHAMATFKPDYTKIEAPALAIYASSEGPPIPPNADEELKKKFREWWTKIVLPYNDASRSQFRREAKHGELTELKGATHYLFLGKTQSATVALTREFLLKK